MKPRSQTFNLWISWADGNNLQKSVTVFLLCTGILRLSNAMRCFEMRYFACRIFFYQYNLIFSNGFQCKAIRNSSPPQCNGVVFRLKLTSWTRETFKLFFTCEVIFSAACFLLPGRNEPASLVIVLCFSSCRVVLQSQRNTTSPSLKFMRLNWLILTRSDFFCHNNRSFSFVNHI